MKITIYVPKTDLENLYKFLNGENNDVGSITWYREMPGGYAEAFAITIDYNDFVNLDDK